MAIELPSWPDLIWSYQDAEKAPPVFRASAGSTMNYARALRSLSRQVKNILLNYPPEKAEDLLRRYSMEIADWAKSAARNMLYGVNRNNLDMFKRQARRMGLDMRIFLAGSRTGEIISRHIENNAKLICTIPQEAARKAGELAHDALINATRPEAIAKSIREIADTADYRAKRIARTETSKAYTALTQARAEDVGSEGYIWRTGRDGAVRPSHRAMEGKFVKWSEPPTLDGMTGHAGEFPNCRCYTEPIIPRMDGTTRAYYSGLSTQKEEKASGKMNLTSKWQQQVGSEVIPHMSGEPLYNVNNAYFEPKKLTAYSMNAHAIKPDGTPNKEAMGKAASWKYWLDFTEKDAENVERQVMSKLYKYPAIAKGKPDKFGQRFNVYIPVTGNNGKTVDVMTAWMYDIDQKTGKVISTRPRLTNCYIDGKIDKNGRYKG